MVGYEHGLRVDQSLPTLEEYWRLRMATSAVKITTAVLLLVYHRRFAIVKASVADYWQLHMQSTAACGCAGFEATG
jgi:hypothetical protein